MRSSDTVAFIGAGGKTTAMFQLARALSDDNGAQRVIVTATSHLGIWQTALADQHIIANTAAPLEALEHGMQGVILVTGDTDGERTSPVDAGLLHWLRQFCSDHAIPLLIEADGSRQKPLKAWAEHEPPIPEFANLVVQVAGLSGIGKPLTAESVHRPELFSERSGLGAGETITADALTRILTHPERGAIHLPARARKTILLNQADTAELQAIAQGIAQRLLAAYDSAIISSLKDTMIYAVVEPVAAIVLAAGEAKRFGRPKQLLDWKGEPFVRAVAKTARQAGLWPVIVVTGSYAEPVEQAVRDLHVTTVHNGEWPSGQASSIKAGIARLSSEIEAGSAIFLLADQPQVTASVLRALVETHARGLPPIVAPMVMDQRANPVLFDRVTFPDLRLLEGDVGGRRVFHKHRVEYLPWHDDRLLLDVDTPEMYQRLLADDSL